MTFGEKLKKLRIEKGLTQDELAEKIYVTRTAISKWETDKGYPSIDSLKQLSILFEISIDELISESDVENQRRLDKVQSRRLYWCAVACLALATLCAVAYYFTQIYHLNIASFVSVVGYVIFALLSKPKYKRMADRRRIIIPFIISRFVIAAVILTVIVCAFVK